MSRIAHCMILAFLFLIILIGCSFASEGIDCERVVSKSTLAAKIDLPALTTAIKSLGR